MQAGQCIADRRAMFRPRPANAEAGEEGDDRRGRAGEQVQDLALLVVDGEEAAQALAGEMLHQPEEERQVRRINAFLVERQDELALLGDHQVVRILDALGDALQRLHRTEVVAGHEGVEFLVGDFGVDGQAGYSAASRSARGRLKVIDSSAALINSTLTAKRSANAAITSSTSTSGADAPAVIPRRRMSSSFDQSISEARWTSSDTGKPPRSATSRSRCELDEFGAPMTIIASTSLATRF